MGDAIKKQEYLERRGYIVGVRNPQINTNFAGSFMVCENPEGHDLPTEDGSNGPWCIVGDNLTKLVNEAFLVALDIYKPKYVSDWDSDMVFVAGDEGWMLSERSDGVLELQRCDEMETFDGDRHAVDFIKSKANAGSYLHLIALSLNGERWHDPVKPEVDPDLPMTLYSVAPKDDQCDWDSDGPISSDLYVWARTPSQAVVLWRQLYIKTRTIGKVGIEDAVRVFEVPVMHSPSPVAIGWNDIHEYEATVTNYKLVEHI